VNPVHVYLGGLEYIFSFTSFIFFWLLLINLYVTRSTLD
jgi:hypothetical protein